MAFKYEVMESVYLLDSAEKGYLEKVTVKRRFLNSGELSSGLPVEDVKVYESSFNRVYLENELLTLLEAAAIIAGG